jgi:alcohol dehydrogenase
MANTQLCYFADSALSNLESLLKKDSPKKIFLVTGKRSFEVSGAKEILTKVLLGYSFVRFSEFTENPKIEDVEKGIRIFREYGCDYIIAVGGGSVIDMAKLINIGQAHNNSLRELVLEQNTLNSSGKKLIAVPTTAGAGSEATHFAVIYIEKKKYSLANSKYVLPDAVFLIPSLTYSMSGYQTAISGIDAFAQAIESFWSVNSTPESKKYSKEAIKLIWKYLPESVCKGNLDAKNKMIEAAYLAGKAINISKTTGAHAISYIFTTHYNIPHGHAVALTLGEWFKFNSNVNNNNITDKRGVMYVRKTMEELSSIIFDTSVESPSLAINDFIKKVGLETRLDKLNITKADIETVINNIDLERLNNNPCQMSTEELRYMLYKVF